MENRVLKEVDVDFVKRKVILLPSGLPAFFTWLPTDESTWGRLIPRQQEFLDAAAGAG